jgi:hypothetical protein
MAIRKFVHLGILSRVKALDTRHHLTKMLAQSKKVFATYPRPPVPMAHHGLLTKQNLPKLPNRLAIYYFS